MRKPPPAALTAARVSDVVVTIGYRCGAALMVAVGWIVRVLRFATVVNVREHVRAVNLRRVLMMVILTATGVPATLALVSAGRDVERAVNVVTLAIVGTCFLAKAVSSGALTIVWTPLAKALTAMAALLCLLFYLSVVADFAPGWVPLPLRWALRLDLIFWVVVFTDAVVSRFIATRHAAQEWPTTIGNLSDVAAGLRSGALHPAEAAELIEESAARLTVPEER